MTAESVEMVVVGDSCDDDALGFCVVWILGSRNELAVGFFLAR